MSIITRDCEPVNHCCPDCGEPLERFVIAQMSGRLARDGKRYRVQSVVQFPELRLNPAEISARAFRITQAVFRCTATFTLPFTQLAFTGCSIESPEMRLTFDQGTLALGRRLRRQAPVTSR